MLEGVDKLAIALSGGKDSITMLKILKNILGRGFPDCELIAIHVKGAFSCGPSVHPTSLEKLCEEMDLPLFIEESHLSKEKLSCYPCSRQRRKLIFEAAKREGATTIAFGHHRDDFAQTLLMNLLHKGEFAGNLPKLELVDFGITIIRPLVFVAEKEILEFARQKGFARITCQCPIGSDSMRKKVDQILDDLQNLFPNVRKNVATAGLIYGSDKAKKTPSSTHK
ncbi:MAG: tRNA-cytidine(32) 2-sulfurtransferase [Chlamydiales bacterium]|nr:tRNA-cytidine(32) 2-sulfurtransferase [Chlamydiales bacterium]MCH9634867.1 tRNA-cytidine(32) 2-sulfurtransferase [Chlamydiales bacterium]